MAVRRIVLVLGLALLSCSTLQVPSANFLTIGVLSNPAEGVLASSYYRGDPYSYLPGSVADYIGSVGAHPIMIPFDVDWEKLQYILERIDAVVLWSEGTSSPFFHEISHKVLNWALHKNANGTPFPVLAIGSSLHTIVTATGAKEGLDCTKNPEKKVKAIEKTSAFAQSRFWKEIDLPALSDSVFSREALFFTTRCSLTKELYEANAALKQDYDVLALTKDQTPLVAILEHKKYPIVGMGFHPEKNLFERGDYYSQLHRDSKATHFSRSVMRRMAQVIRATCYPRLFKEISSQVKQYFAVFRPYELPMVQEYERIVSFQRFNTMP